MLHGVSLGTEGVALTGIPNQTPPAPMAAGEALPIDERAGAAERLAWIALVLAVVIHSLTLLSGFVQSDRIGFRGVGVALSLMMHLLSFVFFATSPAWLLQHLAHRAEANGARGRAAKLRAWSRGVKAIPLALAGLVFWWLAKLLTSFFAMPFAAGTAAIYFIGIPTLFFLTPLFGFVTGFSELAYLRTLPDRKPSILSRFMEGEGRRLWNGTVFVALGTLFVILQVMPERSIGVWAAPAILLLAKPTLFLLSMRELRHRFLGFGTAGAKELLLPAHIVSLCVLPFLFTLEVVAAGLPPIETQIVQMYSPYGLHLSWQEMSEMSEVMLGLLLFGEVSGMVAVVFAARSGRESEGTVRDAQTGVLRIALTVGVLALLPLAAVISVAVVDGPHVVMWMHEDEDGKELEIDVFPAGGQTTAILHLYLPTGVSLPAEVTAEDGEEAAIRTLGEHGTAMAPDPGEFPIEDFFYEQGWIQLDKGHTIIVHEMVVNGMGQWEARFDVPYGESNEEAPLKAMVRMVDEDGQTLDWRIPDMYTNGSD